MAISPTSSGGRCRPNEPAPGRMPGNEQSEEEAKVHNKRARRARSNWRERTHNSPPKFSCFELTTGRNAPNALRRRSAIGPENCPRGTEVREIIGVVWASDGLAPLAGACDVMVGLAGAVVEPATGLFRLQAGSRPGRPVAAAKGSAAWQMNRPRCLAESGRPADSCRRAAGSAIGRMPRWQRQRGAIEAFAKAAGYSIVAEFTSPQ